MGVLLDLIERPDLAPFRMSDRFRHEIAYFIAIPEESGHAPTSPGEYWIDLAQAQVWYDDGAILLVSPLDSQNRTEVELSEEQESWLEWMLANQISHVRLI